MTTALTHRESDRDRVALVTGAARGIGAATVRRLVNDGYRVIALDACQGGGTRGSVSYPLADPSDLNQLAADFPDQVWTAICDVRDAGSLEEVVATGIGRFGPLDAVVACAAVILGGKPLWETPIAHLDTVLDVNVRGVWNTASICVPHLLDNPDPGGCRFVAVGSTSSEHGHPHLTAYGAAKNALIGLVKGLASDLVGTGVTACVVSPGATRTAMLEATASLYESSDVEAFAESQLVRRLLSAEEIAEIIAFCCSPAGAALNRSVVSADGGHGR